MKIVYEENEIEKLEQENSAWKEKGRGGLFDDNDPDRVYSLNFKVTNPVLAEYWIPALLFDELPDFDLGIAIESININTAVNKEELKRKLHEAIEQLV